ncbi:MAG: amino acid adenylation domain-containing protein, partial [Bdellovibrionota bacterium]
MTILNLFEKTVAKYPNNIAVVAKNGSLTYSELSQKSEKLAAYLIENGVKNDDLVGLFIDCSLEMIVAIVAVIKAGAAYVPMAHDTPSERVSYILEDCQAKFLLSLSHLVKNITTKSNIIDINNNFSSYVYKRPKIQENDLLYAIYTSGTTGLPKGTLLENKSVINYINFLIEDNKINSESVGAKFVSIGFDASVVEIYPILLCGGKLCIVPEEWRKDPHKVDDYFTKYNVQYACLPTQFAELFFQLENFSLKNLVVGGDKLRQFLKKPYNIKNSYGPTETTVQSHIFLVDKNYDNIPIGKPLPGYIQYIVDQDMNLVSVGEVGELLIGGSGLARGYLNRPELTAEKFIANPFQTVLERENNFNHKLYKTGDLVRQLPDGNLEFIGRNDFQVKIRGYRIETGEIENLIQKMEEIEQTIVVPLKDSNGNSYLCAYYTSESELNKDVFVQTLSKSLNEYMIPEHFIWLKKFPLDVNGKINRKTLPEPDLTKFVCEYVAPSTPAERLICDAFSKVLGVEKISVNDNFYRLGGNSIKTIFVVSQLQSHFELSVVDIHTHKTPQQLAKNLQVKTVKSTLISQAKRYFYPTTFSQERFFIATQIDANSTLYNLPQRIEITGPLDKEKLGLALDQLILHHSSLRSQFSLENNVLIQSIRDQCELRKTFIKASVAELEGLFQEFIAPFNLEKDPLVRIQLVKVDNNHHELFIDIHHIVFDGGSVASFFQDLVSLYEGKTREPLSLQYVDYAIWQRGEQGLAEINKHGHYWQTLYAGHEFESINLPFDFHRPQKPLYEGDCVTEKLDNTIFNKLVKVTEKNQVSMYSLGLFALNALFYIYTGQEKIVLGSFANGRTRPEIKDMVGAFVTTMPILTVIKNNLSNLELIHSIQNNVLNAVSHQDYPIEFLMKDLKIESQGGLNPFFNVV